MTGAPAVGGLTVIAGLETVIDGLAWIAPPGTTALMEIDGDPQSAPELMWTSRCAQVPATRAVILLDGPGFGDTTTDFEYAHGVAEDVAGLLSEEGTEVGPIEILVFRPDTGSAPWPGPSATSAGAEFRFLHLGGARVHLSLTVPTPGGD